MADGGDGERDKTKKNENAPPPGAEAWNPDLRQAIADAPEGSLLARARDPNSQLGETIRNMVNAATSAAAALPPPRPDQNVHGYLRDIGTVSAGLNPSAAALQILFNSPQPPAPRPTESSEEEQPGGSAQGQQPEQNRNND